jgi:hypothetical protein
MPKRRISISLALPLLQLVLWILLLALPATLTWLQLKQVAGHSNVAEVHTYALHATIHRDSFLPFALDTTAASNAHAIAAVNMPGMFGEILSALSISWPDSWHPQRLPLDTWRAFSLPLFCLPFSWFVGSAIDAMLRRKSMHWVPLVFGCLLFALFIFLFGGLRFNLSSENRADGDWIFWGLGGWALLFAAFPCAWIAQLRRRAKIAVVEIP